MLNDYSRHMEELDRLVADGTDIPVILRQALDALREVVPYDLAAVLRLAEDQAELAVEVATGPLAGPQVLGHRLRLAEFPTIQRALETRQPIPLEEHHHAGDEGDPYDGVLDLPHGHSCMVIPLSARAKNLGVITLDRSLCGRYDEGAVRVAALYGRLVSVAILLAEQKQLLEADWARLREENRRLLAAPGGEAAEMLEAARAPSMVELLRVARQAAPSDLPVLLLGETGTGKEVIARALHEWSTRREGPFVKVNCSAIPENLIESELFGHVKGAFTGAGQDRKGRFLTAHGGTLLLDEIGDMPLGAQAKLLRVLQEGTFEPVGSDETIRVDVRVLAATHRDLEAAGREGRFREDLWYRLAVFPLRVPALRERGDDVLGIAEDLLHRFHTERRGGSWQLTATAREAMLAWHWPGNVRELKNALERATVLAPGKEIGPEHLGLEPGEGKAPAPSTPATDPLPSFEENERRFLRAALERAKGKVHGPKGAAELVGLKPSTLRSKLLKHGLR